MFKYIFLCSICTLCNCSNSLCYCLCCMKKSSGNDKKHYDTSYIKQNGVSKTASPCSCKQTNPHKENDTFIVMHLQRSMKNKY